MEVTGTVSNILGYARGAVDWFRGAVMWLSEQIGGLIEFPVANIYLVLMILISAYVALKVFNIRHMTMEGRYIEYIIIAAVVYFILAII